MPDEGVDPHPIPPVVANHNVLQQPPVIQGNAAWNGPNWDLPQNPPPQVEPPADNVQPHDINVPMEVDQNPVQNDELSDGNDSDLTGSSSDNSSVHFAPNIIEEINPGILQNPAVDHLPVEPVPVEIVQQAPVEEMLPQIHAAVGSIVQDNLGEGLLSVMANYLEEEDIDLDGMDDQEEEHIQENDANNGFFHFHGFAPPELAHIQLGMAQTFSCPLSDEAVPSFPISKEGMDLWEKFFAPLVKKDNHSVIDIPVSWFNFIIMMLLTPEKFNWIKGFLNSSIWDLIQQGNESYQCFKFVIPEACVLEQAPACKIQIGLESEALSQDSSTTLENNIPNDVHVRKRRGKGPLMEDEVRRSPRLQALNNGFKSKPCFNNACLPCNAQPPVLSSKIVRNLASSFCKVSEDGLEEKLNKKQKKSGGQEDSDNKRTGDEKNNANKPGATGKEKKKAPKKN